MRSAARVQVGILSLLVVFGCVALASAERLAGTKGADRLVGTAKADSLFGRGGADLLLGKAGGDRLRGGAGPDTLIGGGGADLQVGGPGRDQFNARANVLTDGAGNDRILARDGTEDLINCGAGSDTAIVDSREDGVYDCEVIKEP